MTLPPWYHGVHVLIQLVSPVKATASLPGMSEKRLVVW